MPKIGSIPTDWLIDPALVISKSAPDEDPIVDLTQRELDMIVYALDYVSLEKIADAFGIDYFDADNALSKIYRKLCD